MPASVWRRVASNALFLCIALGTPLLGAPAWSQNAAENRAACMPDALRFCATVIPDLSRVKRCMQSHWTELDPACRSVFPAADAEKSVLRQRGAARLAARIGQDAWPRGQQTSSDQAISATRRIITGIAQGCESQRMPVDVCDAYGQFLGSLGQ